jgi:hypothetical protein
MTLRTLGNLGAFILAASAITTFAQQKHAGKTPSPSADPVTLERTFTAGSTSQYRIQVSVRTELEGQQPETIGAKTYVHPFARSAERRIAWRSTVHILSVGSDGAADMEETLNDFSSSTSDASPPGDAEAAKLTKALEEMSADWTTPETRIFRYRELRAGQLLGLESTGVPSIVEASPPLLTLWLLRALRPVVVLPARPISIGDHWQEPRAVSLEGWAEVKGTENGEWLEPAHAVYSAADAEPAVRLLVIQQIQGKIAAGPEKPPEGAADGRFHAESLATLSLSDGHVLAATRSATREITWTLAPVPGLDRPPEFHARLSVQIEIEECHGPCTTNDVRAGN